MIVYNNPIDLVKNEFGVSAKKQLYPIIQTGELVFRDIVNESPKIFNSNLFSSIIPKIRTRAIYCQFESDMLANDFPFKCRMRKVNNFNDHIPEIIIGNLVLHIAYTPKSDVLPSFAQYKDRYSNLNTFSQKQMTFELSENPLSIVGVTEDKYYGVIAFGGKNELEFVNLIIPSPGFKGILYKTNLKQEIKLVKIDTESSTVTRRRLEIREHILKEIEREGERNATK